MSKTSVAGIGVLSVLFMALAIPGKASAGVLLPMLIIADIFAVIYYRRSGQITILLKVLPPMLVGVVAGYFLMKSLPDANFERVIGVVILLMVSLDLLITSDIKDKMRQSFTAAMLFGVAAGAASMIANAAGPIMGLYMLQLGLTKKEFVGTQAWFFLIMNSLKVPFSAELGLITFSSLMLNLIMVPILLIGAFIGVKLLARLDLNIFQWFVRITAGVAALKLILF